MTEELRAQASSALAEIAALIGRQGACAESMEAIGRLMETFADASAVDQHLGQRSSIGDDEPSWHTQTDRRLLAAGSDGTKLLSYQLDDWTAPPAAHVHWHNYWQSLYVVRGQWADTVWEPIEAPGSIDPRSIRVARREILGPGTVQALRPDEPHGWEAHEGRAVRDVFMLLWSGNPAGQPRMELDLETGAVEACYGLLNPAPETLSKGPGPNGRR
jgi:hypothetical protein